MTPPPEIPATDAFDRPHGIEIVVGADEIDGLGHANNAVYVAWCERVAWAHSASVGLDLERYRELDRAMAVRRSTFDYRAPAFEGDRLAVVTWIEACDRLTATRQFTIRRVTDDKLLLCARIEFVCVDLERYRPRRMPQEFFERYSRMICETDDEAGTDDQADPANRSHSA